MNQRKAMRCRLHGHRIRSLSFGEWLFGVFCAHCGEYIGDALAGVSLAVTRDGLRYERSGRWINRPKTNG